MALGIALELYRLLRRTTPTDARRRRSKGARSTCEPRRGMTSLDEAYDQPVHLSMTVADDDDQRGRACLQPIRHEWQDPPPRRPAQGMDSGGTPLDDRTPVVAGGGLPSCWRRSPRWQIAATCSPSRTLAGEDFRAAEEDAGGRIRPRWRRRRSARLRRCWRGRRPDDQRAGTRSAGCRPPSRRSSAGEQEDGQLPTRRSVARTRAHDPYDR